MKRILAVIMMLAVAAAAFAGGEQEQSGSDADGIQVNAPGEYPVVLGDEPYEIDVFTIYLDAETDGDRENAAFTEWFEDLTNVRVNFDVASSAVHTERQNLLIASGDLPDVFMSQWGMNAQEAFTYGISGTLVPLTEYVENRMPNLAAALEEYPNFRPQIYAPDGEIYTLPTTGGGGHVQARKKAYIYTPWLEELGLDMPETTEELRTALEAFRDQDPNGNGAADEIPFMSSTNGWQTNPIDFVMNSFIYTDTHGRVAYLMRDDGDIVFVADTPEWREGVTYMADLVSDGLLAPETFVQQNDQLIARTENPDVPLVGFVTAGQFGVFTTINGPSGRYIGYRSVPPLEGPNGERNSWYNPPSARPHTKVTSAAERPDIIAQWADYFYGGAQEQFFASRYWREGIEYRLPTEEEIATVVTDDNVPPQIVPLITPQYGVDKHNDGWGRTVPAFQPVSPIGLTDIDDPGNLGYRLMVATYENHMPYVGDNWLPEGLVVDPQYTDILADVTAALVSGTGVVSQWTTEFIIGERDIRDDAEWNAYLLAVEAAGRDTYVEIWSERFQQAGY
jgi:putative aldouronate transport system substrate-binding protein